MKKDTLISVLNRDNGAVLYVIPELNNLRRIYQPNERKEVPFDELVKLSYLPGGTALLKDSLVIENEEAVNMILGGVEPEYNYTPENVKEILVNGSLDELLDCLDFAPEGVTELIKAMAVDLPLNDVAKREAILEKLNFNVTNAINIKKESMQTAEVPAHPTKRRVQKTEEATPAVKARRVVKSE